MIYSIVKAGPIPQMGLFIKRARSFLTLPLNIDSTWLSFLFTRKKEWVRTCLTSLLLKSMS